MNTTLHIPVGATVRLHLRPGVSQPYVVVLAARGGAPSPETLLDSRSLAALLTHDEEVSWPDRCGEALMVATLNHGGSVMLAFCTLADALACKARLDREMGR